MIQRIQTVFFILAIAALGLFLWMPVMGEEYTRISNSYKGWEITSRFPLQGEVYIYFINAIFAGIAAGITLLNIFLFKKRKVQMVLCWVAIVFIASLGGYTFYEYYNKVFIGDVILTYWNLLPLAAIALEILAFVYIRKDEQTIRSLDRLR